MISYEEIRATAEENAGGVKALAARMPELKSDADIRNTPSAVYFSAMSFRIFSSGLNQTMVRTKWPAFEKAFHDFEPAKVAFMSEDDIAALMDNTAIIRHLGKIRATHHNALALVALEKEYGSIGNYLADWPLDDITGLYEDIKSRFKQLGGNSGPYFVRMMGKDGFIMTPDVVSALNQLGVGSGKLTSKKDRAAVQEAFNRWHEESGAPYAHISRTLAIWTG
ncbi:DNA-3-methyladenine glycosylase I [Sneathiella litorea]|uniref:DNA-3-methyladenine glycosylase I n=1 Tax=Sneathiella litorea TaxID=2606216 RepID=A0A6L8W9P9_9PROT|nr:DNA-3-methyladenine glycosylase I [Sneathiella litorea]MZR31791.1 DNA-3-methyladenine glycosylase I [Sneathiella litorea]